MLLFPGGISRDLPYTNLLDSSILLKQIQPNGALINNKFYCVLRHIYIL